MKFTRTGWPTTLGLPLVWPLCTWADPAPLEPPRTQVLSQLQGRAQGGDAVAAHLLCQRLETCATARVLATLRAGT